MTSDNPLSLRGIEFTEFCGPSVDALERLFLALGFSKLRRHPVRDITYFRQNDIHFLLNAEQAGFNAEFSRVHGPSICSMGWRVDDAQFALQEAVRAGARAAERGPPDPPYPAIYGIGDSLIYFIDRFGSRGSIYERDFVPLDWPDWRPEKGFLSRPSDQQRTGRRIAALGRLLQQVFGFTEVRYFDIRGVKTGLTSYALRSPDGSFCIPINEPKSDADQISEYLKEYKGPGVQHLAFLTDDILASLDATRAAVASRRSTSTQTITAMFSTACPA